MSSPTKPQRARRARAVQPSAPTPARREVAPSPPVIPPEAPARSRWPIGAVLVAALAAFGVMRAWGRGGAVAVKRTEARVEPPPPAARVLEGRAWAGEIETHEVAIPLPAEHIHPNECITMNEPWIFNGRDLDGVLRLARGAGVAEPDVAHLRSLTHCDPGGCIVARDSALVTALTPAARSAIYQELYRFPENRLLAYPAVRPKAFGRWGDDPRISPRLRGLIDQATWEMRDRYAFSDLPWLCTQLTTDQERGEAMAALYTRYGLEASVRVPPAGDLEPMVRYWSVGNDPDEVRATLLQARARGGLVPVASLLPTMARVRLNRFPHMSELEYDCFWTATHFFAGATPNDDFPGNDGIARVMRTAYNEIPMSEARLGDVITFSTSTGAIVHTVNLVAGDLVFSKNGLSRTQAWVLTRLDTLLRAYRAASVRAYRLR